MQTGPDQFYYRFAWIYNIVSIKVRVWYLQYKYSQILCVVCGMVMCLFYFGEASSSKVATGWSRSNWSTTR